MSTGCFISVGSSLQSAIERSGFGKDIPAYDTAAGDLRAMMSAISGADFNATLQAAIG